MVEEPAHLVRRRPDHHRALQLGVVPADGRARLGDEHVARAKLDVVRDRVRPRAAQPDLAAVAGLDAVCGRQLALVARADRREEGERRLVPGAEARLRLGRTGSRVLLQEAVRVLAPVGALADQGDLRLALPGEHVLDRRRERRHRGVHHRAQRRSLVAEDPRVPVLVGTDPPADAEVVEHAAEDPHRVLRPRVLGVRLDVGERRLGPDALDLEVGDEHRHLASRALGEDDGALGREEPEPGEVADVVLVEEDVAAQLVGADELEQPLTARPRARSPGARRPDWPRRWPRATGRAPRRPRARFARRARAPWPPPASRSGRPRPPSRPTTRRCPRRAQARSRWPEAMSNRPASAASIAPRSNRSTIARSSGESRSVFFPTPNLMHRA